MTGLPPHRPGDVRIGPFTWTLHYDDETLIDAQDTDGQGRFGMTAPRTHRITVAVASRPEQAIRETVVHEVLHAINVTYSLKVPEHGDPGEKEEQAVATLATPLLEVLQRNPLLLRWLVG